MKASQLIEELQRQMEIHGDKNVGVVMDGEQDRTADEITKVWTLTVSERMCQIVIDCKSVGLKLRAG